MKSWSYFSILILHRDGGGEKYGKLRDIRNESNKEISKGHVTPREMGIDAKLTMGMTKKFDLILDNLEVR